MPHPPRAAAVGDPARLAALDATGLLDTPPEEAFDRYTRLAVAALGTPVALVSLVDAGRQFFKSVVGLPEPWATARQTPLSHSFCRHVAESAEPLVVSDARSHPLLRDNLAVRDLGVVAYLGVPLCTPDGHALGSLCVIEPRPRDWAEREVGVLRDLAASVMTEVGLRAVGASLLAEGRRLRESEERYRLLFDSNPHPMWVYDLGTLRFVAVNDAAVRLYGYARDEFLGMTIRDIRPAEDIPGVDAAVAGLTTDPTEATRWRHRKSDGTLIDVEVRSCAVRDGGRPARLVLALDVTDRVRAEAEVRRTTGLLQAVADGTPDAVFVKDLAGRYLLFNEAAARFVGRPAAEVLGRDDTALFGPADARHVMANDRRVVESGETVTQEEELTAAGATRTYLATKLPYRDAAGGVLGVIGVSRDISDRKRAEAALRDSEARFAAFMGHTPMLAWVKDAAGRHVFANRAFEHLYGMTAADWRGRTDHELFPVGEADGYVRTDREVLAGGGPREYQAPLGGPDGAERHWWFVKFPVPDAGGGHLVGGMAVDVTGRVRAEEAVRVKEQRYRWLVETTAEAVWRFEVDGPVPTAAPEDEQIERIYGHGYLAECNEGMARMYAAPSAAAMAGARLADMMPRSEPVNEAYLRAFVRAGYRLADAESVEVGADGLPRYLLNSLVGEVEGGLLVRAFGTSRDVTDRKRAELLVRASEERFRTLVAATAAIVWNMSPAGEFVAEQPGWAAFTGQSFDEYRGWGWLPVIHPDDRDDTARRWAAAVAARESYHVEQRVRRADGEHRHMSVRAVPILEPSGTVREWVGVHTDITERKRAEVAVRTSERLLRQVIDADPNLIAVKDSDGRFVLANRALAAAYGAAAADALVGRIDADFNPAPAEVAAYRAADRGVIDTGEEFHDPEEPFTTAAGERRWLRTTKRPLEDGDGRRAAVLMVSVDITAWKEAADALEASNRLYRLLADHVQDVVSLMGDDGACRYVSPSCERLIGHTPAETLRAGMRGLAHPDDRVAVERGWAAAVAGGTATVEWRCRHRDGRYLWVETVFTPVSGGGPEGARVVASSRDVTARRAAEEQFRQAQKMEAVGQLAGGVAHDFNNLLTVVTGCAELLLDAAPPAAERELVENIARAGERGAALTHQLLAFSRQQMLTVEVFDPNRVVLETAKLLARLLGEDISLRTALDHAAGRVKADPGQVGQVVINLAVNGRDAMPRGGTLLIETAAADVTEADLPPSPDARPGGYVRLAVTDAGEGMTPEVQARLFEPFFTTKPAGKGTGLGLATVYGIVRQSGGFVTVDSRVGRGTTFAVYLPRYEEAEAGPKSVPRPKPKATGSETVLVVEDDAAVRALTTAVLTRRGYRVEAAATGADALAACGRMAAPPDLLLTDVVMPGMSGREVAEALAAEHPRLRVGFLSGYTADAVLRHGVADDRVAFLQKPFTADALARFVRGLLDGAPRG